MFKQKKGTINPNTTDTLIGEGTLFEGRIKSEASIRVEGGITGDIECAGDVAIGELGVANSNISARNVIIAGTVHGNVTAKGTLTISSKGKLHGNMGAQSLIIAEGGVFLGTSKMDNGSEEKQQPEHKEPQAKPLNDSQFGGTTIAL